MFCLFCFLLTNTTSPDNFHKSVNIAHSLSSTSTSSISPLSHDSSLLNNQNDPTIYNPSILKSRLSSCDLNTKPRPFIKKMSVTDVRATVAKECLVTFEQNINENENRRVRDKSPYTFRAVPLSVSENLKVK